MKKMMSVLMIALFVLGLIGCKSENKTYLEKAADIINLHDGAIYQMYEDKNVFKGVETYYTLNGLDHFQFKHAYNLFVIDVEKHRDKMTIQQLNSLYALLESENRVSILFVNFTTFVIFKNSEFEITDTTHFEHSSWALFRSNFSESRSVNINGELDEKISFSAMSLLSRSIVDNL